MNEIIHSNGKIAENNANELRELAFHELESSHATLRKIANLMNVRDPLVKRLSQVLGVAETSLRTLEEEVPGEIKTVTGPIYGEEELAAHANGHVSNGNGPAASNGNASAAPEATAPETKVPAEYATAHARRLNHCGARHLGCTFKTHGNSYGRHQQFCEYFQTARLLEARYKIESFEDFVKALKKENGGEVGTSEDGLRSSIERNHGSYRKFLLGLKKTMKQSARK